MLYNIVDRIYIGNIPGTGAIALTGVGVPFPILLLVSAFAAFAGMGGAPLASIQLYVYKRQVLPLRHPQARTAAKSVRHFRPPGDTPEKPAGVPVSYTHLDVYKRQLHSISVRMVFFSFSSAIIMPSTESGVRHRFILTPSIRR